MSQLGRLTLIICVLLSCFSGAAYSAEHPTIMVSIKPFYNLCAKVMQSVGKPQLLLQHNASPHDYQLKPSDIKAIMSSDLVVWGGPELESFLQKPIANVQASKNLNLATIPDLKLLPIRSGTNWEEDEHDHNHNHEHDHEHDHDHTTNDPHFWLNTDNSIVIVKAIATQLIKIDPKHAEIYTKNTNNYINELKIKKTIWEKELAPVKNKPFIAFHDAYQYFEREFGLKGVGSISLNPEIPPSAQRIQQIQTLLKQKQVSCIFSEPQFNNKIILTLTDKIKIQHGILDPLGQDKDLGPNGYFVLIDNLVNSFATCGNK